MVAAYHDAEISGITLEIVPNLSSIGIFRRGWREWKIRDLIEFDGGLKGDPWVAIVVPDTPYL